MIISFKWERPEIAPTMDDPRFHNLDIVGSGFGQQLQMWRQRQPIYGHVKDLPPERQKIFHELRSLSYLHMPIVVRGDLWGIIALAALQEEHNWSQHEVEAVQIIADMLGTVIERQQIEQTYRGLADYSLQGLTIIQDGHIVFANQTVAEISGYTIDELLHFSAEEVQALVHPNDRAFVFDLAQKRLAGEQTPEQYAFRIICKDGTTRWVDQYVSLIEYRGEPATQTAYVDITERKQAEKALHLTQYSVDTLQNAVLWIRPDASVMYANHAACNQLGYSHDELLRLSVPDFDLEWSTEYWFTEGWQRLKENGLSIFESRNRRKDGAVFPIEAVTNYVKFEDQEYLFAFVVDITNRKLAEQQIQQLSERFSKIFHSNPAVITLSTLDGGCFIEVNQAFEDIFGFTREEAIGHTSLDLGIWETTSDRAALMDQVSQYGAVRNIEIAVRAKSGKRLTLLGSFEMLVINNEPMLLSSFVDITERKQAEEALRQSEEKFAIAFRASPVAISISSLEDQRLLDVNEFFLQAVGYTREEIIGKTTLDLDLWARLDQRDQFFQMLSKQGVVQNLEIAFRRKSGEIGIALMSAEIIELNGKPHILAILNDITERRQMEDMLREGEQRYRILTEHTPLGIWQLDLDGYTLYANPAMCAMLEIENHRELTGEPYHTFIAPEYIEQLEAERAKRWGGFMSSYELELIPKSGQKRFVIMSGGPVFSAEGEPHSLIGAFTDITKRKQAELALQRSARLSAIGELAAAVAHQINNPLFTVITDSQLLLNQMPLHTPGRESAEAIQRAATRAGEVVQRLLDFSRAKPSTVHLIDVNVSVKQAVDLIRVQVEHQAAQLRVELAPSLPLIEASEEHLQDVWINLLLNARDAVNQTENAMIRIATIYNIEHNKIEVVVEDNGKGISEEDLAQIFTPFFTTKTHGTGLGLAVCYDIVKFHGGMLSVKSALGQGTTFTVSLPAQRAIHR